MSGPQQQTPATATRPVNPVVDVVPLSIVAVQLDIAWAWPGKNEKTMSYDTRRPEMANLLFKETETSVLVTNVITNDRVEMRDGVEHKIARKTSHTVRIPNGNIVGIMYAGVVLSETSEPLVKEKAA